MGQIIRFPILILDEKASEERFGITPQLEDTIRVLSGASTESVASEQAIREAIDNIVYEVSGSNLVSGGLPIFNSVTGERHVMYNSLSGLGVITVTSGPEEIFLGTTQTGDPGENVSIAITERTLNGGIEQEASKINYSDFDETTGVSTSGFPAFHNVNADDIIGKILIKYTEQYNDTTTQFCIGTEDNISGIVKPFSVSGATVGQLIDFEYGDLLDDKVIYVEQYGDSLVYTRGIFFGGTGDGDAVDQIVLATNVVTSIGTLTYGSYHKERSIEDDTKCLVAYGDGGRNNPFKWLFATDTETTLAGPLLYKGAPFNSTDKAGSEGLMWGGTGDTTGIRKGVLSTETFSSVGTYSFGGTRTQGGNGRSNTYAYALGGGDDAVHILSYETYTAQTLGSLLTGTYSSTNGRYNNLKGYVVWKGNVAGGGTDVITYSSNTVAARSATCYAGGDRSYWEYQGSFASHTHGYNGGGNGVDTAIDSYSFTTDTETGIFNADLTSGRQYMAACPAP